MRTVTDTPTRTKPPDTASYTVQLTAAQIFGFADLVRRLGQAYGPDADQSLRQDLVDALNAFVQLLPEPSDKDGDAYLAAMRAGELPNWGMDDQPLTETVDEWTAKVRARLAADAAQDEKATVPQPPASPDAVTTRAFPGLPGSVSAARSWVAGFFPDPAASADAALMTSELVTNAITHTASRLTGGQVTVSVAARDGMVRVDVTDDGELHPFYGRRPGLGLGLQVVAALAHESGTDGPDRWFTLAAGGAR